MTPDFYDLAQIYQQRALKTLSEEDLAHAKRYRIAGDGIRQLRAIIDEEAKDSALVIIERDNLRVLCDQLGEQLTTAMAYVPLGGYGYDDCDAALAAWRKLTAE